MSIEMEAADVLVDPGEGVEFLDGPLCCLQHLALHTLRPTWDILNFGGLQPSVNLQPKSSTQRLLQR